jgi:hypothetical protein
LWPGGGIAGDVFTGYQIDHQGQYYTYLGVRSPLTSGESNLQPFIQVMGAGLGYTFKDHGAKRDAEVQFATPSLGLKYVQGSWNFIGLAGPQFWWKQEDRPTGGRTNEQDVGVYLRGEAFYCMKGRFTPLRRTRIWITVWSRVKTQADLQAIMAAVQLSGVGRRRHGGRDFYAVQTGPLVQSAIERVQVTLKGGYQIANIQNGVYGGIEFYVPF